MSIVRIKKERNFVQINKEMLEEQQLSLKAKGLISFCLTKPDDWQFHIEQLASVLKEGERSIRSALNEAITAGYAFRFQTRKENGDFGPWEIIVTDSKETLRKHKEAILSTGKIEIVFTERRFALAQVADPQNSRLLILEDTKNDCTNKPIPVPKPEDPKPDKKGEGGFPLKEEWQFLKDIDIQDRDKQRLISRYSPSLVKQVIDYVTSPDFVLDKTLEAAIFYYVKNPDHLRENNKEKEIMDDSDQVLLNRNEAEKFACEVRKCPDFPVVFHGGHEGGYVEFRHLNGFKIYFNDKKFDEKFKNAIKSYGEYVNKHKKAQERPKNDL